MSILWRMPVVFVLAVLPLLSLAQNFVADSQAFDSSFFESSVDDPFATSNPTAPANYGLAPEFNKSRGGNLTRLEYTGTGTIAYEQMPLGFGGAVGLSCSIAYLEPRFQSAYVGISSDYYLRSFSCGRCIRLQCDDASCEEPGNSVVASVVDACGECADADLNIATPLFEKLSGRDGYSNPQLAISWDWVDCSPYINGTIKLLVRPGGSAYFQSFGFPNSRQVITAVAVNNERLKHTTSNTWEWNPGQPLNPAAALEIALLGASGEVLRVRIGQLRSQDLQVQFSAPVEASPPAAELDSVPESKTAATNSTVPANATEDVKPTVTTSEEDPFVSAGRKLLNLA